MAAGDPQRVWFPEMLARLRCEWNSHMSFPALIELRNKLDAMLERIRSERHIASPVFRCPSCGAIGCRGKMIMSGFSKVEMSC